MHTPYCCVIAVITWCILLSSELGDVALIIPAFSRVVVCIQLLLCWCAQLSFELHTVYMTTQDNTHKS